MRCINTDILFEPGRVQVAVKFIEVAEQDLEAAKILLDYKFYPQALFMLQQAVEKSVKAVMYAMTELSIKELKRRVKHEILRHGFYITVENLLERLRSWLQCLLLQPDTVNLLCICNEIRQLFRDMVEKSIEAKKRAEEKTRELSNYVNKLGSLALEPLKDNIRKKVDALLDKISQVVYEPASYFSTEVFSIPNRLWKAFTTCLRKVIRDRNQRTKIETVLRKQFNEVVGRVVRGVYLVTSYAILTALHGFFEHNIGSLRYPDEKWTPLSIGENTVIVHVARQLIDFFDKTTLLQTMKEFLEGKIETERTRKIYESLMNLAVVESML